MNDIVKAFVGDSSSSIGSLVTSIRAVLDRLSVKMSGDKKSDLMEISAASGAISRLCIQCKKSHDDIANESFLAALDNVGSDDLENYELSANEIALTLEDEYMGQIPDSTKDDTCSVGGVTIECPNGLLQFLSSKTP